MSKSATSKEINPCPYRSPFPLPLELAVPCATKVKYRQPCRGIHSRSAAQSLGKGLTGLMMAGKDIGRGFALVRPLYSPSGNKRTSWSTTIYQHEYRDTFGSRSTEIARYVLRCSTGLWRVMLLPCSSLSNRKTGLSEFTLWMISYQSLKNMDILLLSRLTSTSQGTRTSLRLISHGPSRSTPTCLSTMETRGNWQR